MKKILLTGGSGFVGSNILPFLQQRYDVFAPTRRELDVRNFEQVQRTIGKERYDVIVHLASPSPVRSSNLDSYDKLFEDCLKIFMNLYAMRDYCGKVIYSGSGAEYDKRNDLRLVNEDEIGNSIPIDDYGRAKFIMNELARSSQNIYNLRIFGCYGPREYDSKFITHAVRCGCNREPITIKQDCYFDYLYVDDYAKYLLFCIENNLAFHDYNASSGKRVKLSQIAQEVQRQLNLKEEIVILKEGLNKEYSASNSRIISEMKDIELTSIESGIENIIRCMTTKNR